MTKPRVYLSGPMRGLHYDQANEWRAYAAERLWPDIATFSPMRGKKYLRDIPTIPGEVLQPNSTRKAIVTRDRMDTMNCDMILVNLLDAEAVSIGTMFEMAWADAVRVPMVVVMEDEGNPHDHPFVRETPGWLVEDLDEALAIIRLALLPDPIGSADALAA